MEILIACGGVLVPAGGSWRRTCFVEERGLAGALAVITYADFTCPLQVSSDHYLPKSVWPEDGRLHNVHLYCQKVQGRQIMNANGAAFKGGRKIVEIRIKSGYFQSEKWSETARKGNHSLPRNARVLGGLNQPTAAKSQGGLVGGPRGMHVRWHVNRGIVKAGCALCESAS
jgi:hypothetical protein